jgi:pimeloyl-ACP methyl ester carboxylesterase
MPRSSWPLRRRNGSDPIPGSLPTRASGISSPRRAVSSSFPVGPVAPLAAVERAGHPQDVERLACGSGGGHRRAVSDLAFERPPWDLEAWFGVELNEELEWRGRRVRWTRRGSGPAVVFCHGTPWSSRLWAPFAEALSSEFATYLWDMPGYGRSSMDSEHRVSLDVQGELLHDLIAHWGLDAPHVVAHDYGGAVALRAHLLRGSAFSSLALVDVVALAPWGSDFFRLVRDHPDVFAALPTAVHEGAVRAYVAGASHAGLTPAQADMLVSPWLGHAGQGAFYRQIAQADQSYTDEIEHQYVDLDLPVLVVWGRDDAWIPVDRAHRLAALIPGARLELIDAAGHLVQLDQPVELATILHRWLRSPTTRARMQDLTARR